MRKRDSGREMHGRSYPGLMVVFNMPREFAALMKRACLTNDKAQQRESLRTAYVAITRAVICRYWYLSGEERVPASAKASRHIQLGEVYWYVNAPQPAPPSNGITRRAPKQR